MAEVGRGERERVVVAEWSWAMAIGLVAVTGGIFAGGLVAFVGASGAKERVTLGVVAAVLAVPFLVVVRRVPPMLRGMGVEVDGEGVRPFDGRRSTLVPWPDIAGVGFGSDMVHRYGTKRPSVPAFEIYLRHAGDADRFPGLRSDWRTVQAPAEDLSAGCFSYRLSGSGSTAEQLEAAVRGHRPELWRGSFVHDHAEPG
jgi:hypothetical protein